MIEIKPSEKQTMGDKIRNMDNDNLAKFLSENFYHGLGETQLKNWLESEVRV